MTASPAVPLAIGAAGAGVAVAWLLHPREARAAVVAAPLAPPVTADAAPAPAPLTADAAPALLAGAWVFPVPDLADRPAQVSDGWGSPRRSPDGTARRHLGVDIMYRRRQRAELVDRYPPSSPHGSRWYFMPDGVPALAAGAGVVSFAASTPRGFTVKVRHPGRWTTYYTHLSALQVAAGQVVAAGQPVGIIGGDPLDRRHLMHLHFELWRDHARAGAVDPLPYLRTWPHHPLAAELRNRGAALTYRPLGAPGDRYPAWVAELRGQSGVYVIRERDDRRRPVVVYVGESHTGRLYETLTRHFQTWRRFKGFWRGQYAEGHDPGLTYARERVEVATRVLSAADAIDEERRLIARLGPRDNLLGQPEDDAPF